MTAGVSQRWATDHAPSWTQWQRIATPNYGARTHLWRELDYKLPPSAAVPMKTEKAKAKSDGQVIWSLNPAVTVRPLVVNNLTTSSHCFTLELLDVFCPDLTLVFLG